jgi:hypothetical protein
MAPRKSWSANRSRANRSRTRFAEHPPTYELYPTRAYIYPIAADPVVSRYGIDISRRFCAVWLHHTLNMFHLVLAIASRFLCIGNVLQGFARAILTLRNLGLISSHLIPALSPPPPIALLDAAVPFVGLPEEVIPPYPSGGLIALERIARQPPPFASSIPSYQSSLITVPSSQLPILLPLFIILLAIISGSTLLLPDIVRFFMKSRSISMFVSSTLSPHFPPAGPLLLWTIGPVRTHHMSFIVNGTNEMLTLT